MRPSGLVVAAIALSLLGGCGGFGSASEVERLESLGFFALATPPAAERACAEVRDDPDSGVFSLDSNRFFFADAEDLAEGGVAALLRELGPVLRRLGVPRLVLREDFNVGGRYTVYVNGRRHLIYSRAELEDDRPGLLWGLSAARTVRLLNILLRAAGSREQAYGYASGNDFSIFLLTPKLRAAVADIVDSPRDTPYELTETYPNFGAPPAEPGFGWAGVE